MTSHILPLSKFVLGLKIAQLVISLVVLGLAAYGVTFVAFDGISLTLFVAIATMIITVYYIVATTALTAAYNYWAVLGLDIFAVLFWIIAFPLLASEIAAFSWVVSYSSYDSCYLYCYKVRSVEKRATTDLLTYRNALAAAAGLGGLEFILFIITLVLTSISLHRHRAAGGHCTANSMNSASPPNNVNSTGVPVTYETKGVELHGQNATLVQAAPAYPVAPHDQPVLTA